MKRKVALFLTFVLILTSANVGTGIQAKADELFDNAQVLPLNGQWNGEIWFSKTDNEKYYKIDVPSDGYLTFKIMSYNDDLTWKFYGSSTTDALFSKSSWEFDDAQDASPVTKEYTYGLSKGSYYLKCAEGEGRFKVQASFESFEANDDAAVSYDSPQDLPLGQVVTGATTETDTEDWYRIQITEPGKYAVTVKSYVEYLDWYIYDVDRVNTIDDSRYDYYGAKTVSPITVRHNVTFTPGTYYILCKNVDRTGKYQIEYEKLTQSNCSHDFESSYISSTYFSKGYTLHRCKNCGYSYKDSYSDKKKISKAYIWSYGMKAGKKQFKVMYSSLSDVSGYQIRYATNRKFKKAKTVKVGRNTLSKTVKKLKKKQKYYVQVRGYVKQGKKVAYGAWSDKRTVKTK